MNCYERLKSMLEDMGGVVIGYSGGVDSTLLAKAATDALGEKAVCVTVESALNPKFEVNEAVDLAETLRFNLVRLQVDVFKLDIVTQNDPDRCYHCKKELFSHMVQIASERGLNYVLDGANADDADDYRPGSRATKELGVRSPLRDLGLTKERIRAMSRELGLPTWNKPSYACLASRVPYGTALTPENLEQVELAEDELRRLGFHQFRVRHHGDLARIELMPAEMDKIVSPDMRHDVVRRLQLIGFKYVAMDLLGYRTGSMNEVLNLEG